MAKTEQSERRPPYIPWSTFLVLVDRLATTGAIPPVIDSSVTSNFSGIVQAQLRSALKFLGLVSDKNATQQTLKHLVLARGTEKWSALLGDVLNDAYAPIVGDIDLANATQAQLNEAFKVKGGAEGQVKQKAVRFFLSATKEAGIQTSPYFTVSRTSGASPASNGRKFARKSIAKKAARGAQERNTAEEHHESPVRPSVPKGCMLVPFPLRDDLILDVVMPLQLTTDEVERIAKFYGAYAR